MKCPLCRSECRPFSDQKLQVGYGRCDLCQLIFKSPEHHPAFSEQKKRYDLHQNSEESDGYRAYFRRFLDFVTPRTGSIENALDFGCGATTLLANMLREEGVGCDAYDPLYRPDQSYMNKTYDLIVSVEVFEHLRDPGETFGDLLARLNKGGYLAIQTQFHSNDSEIFLDWYYRLDPTHIMFFRPETFRYLCEKHGCKYRADNGKNILLIQK